jgi:hypothetical protein
LGVLPFWSILIFLMMIFVSFSEGSKFPTKARRLISWSGTKRQTNKLFLLTLLIKWIDLNYFILFIIIFLLGVQLIRCRLHSSSSYGQEKGLDKRMKTAW